MRRRTLLISALGPAGLAACGTPRPAVLPAAGAEAPPSLLDTLAAQAAPAGGRLWRVDPKASTLRIVAFRGGAAPQLGHHHILQASSFQSALWLPSKGLASAQGELRVPLAALQVDDPAWRAAAGGEFNEKPVDDDARAGTLRNLLGPQGLDATAHPEVRLQLLRLTGAAPWWLAEVAVTLAGITRPYRLGLGVQQGADSLRLSGQLVLRQTEHGRQPFSILGGLLAMQDDVLLDFSLLWRP